MFKEMQVNASQPLVLRHLKSQASSESDLTVFPTRYQWNSLPEALNLQGTSYMFPLVPVVAHITSPGGRRGEGDWVWCGSGCQEATQLPPQRRGGCCTLRNQLQCFTQQCLLSTPGAGAPSPSYRDTEAGFI